MFKLLKKFGERFKCEPIIKRKLSSKNDLNKANSQRVITIRSIEEFYDKLMKSDSPVVVNFSAAWCLNCSILSPLVESIVSSSPRKVVLLKVDVDDHMDLALSYNVSAIPVLFGVSRGQVRNSLVGLHETEKIESWINDFLKTA
ncbi:hypothetical protein HA402_004630 [Bradysia odoriphaga]|nr:hypothetical protein HA402_004630 [Bradysia odoriphaga]